MIAFNSFALQGFSKEGGGYGVKPIREIIKESEEGLYSEMDLDSWMDQREETLEFHELIILYRKALNIRKEVMSLYEGLTREEFNKRRREVLFIQGLLIIDIDKIDRVTLTNDIVLPQQVIRDMSKESQKVLNIQIEDGYFVVDLLKRHNVKQIKTNIEGARFKL
jgi:hypothetical protein